MTREAYYTLDGTRMMIRIFIAILAAFLSACATTQQPMTRSPQENTVQPEEMGFASVADPAAEINNRLVNRNNLLFRSRSGVAYRMDSDTEILLSVDGRVELTEYGYAVMQFDGEYLVGTNGAISLQMPQYKRSWPSMKLFKKDADLYLFPDTNSQGFIFGMRAAATQTPSMNDFWPFKLIENDHK